MQKIGQHETYSTPRKKRRMAFADIETGALDLDA
jgi:hypothetical protein